MGGRCRTVHRRDDACSSRITGIAHGRLAECSGSVVTKREYDDDRLVWRGKRSPVRDERPSQWYQLWLVVGGEDSALIGNLCSRWTRESRIHLADHEDL